MHRAEVLHRSFPPTPARPFQMERHYLVYADRGRMLLEDGGRGWSLQPARAALVRAGEEIRVTLPAAIQALSVLFCPRAYPPPEATLSVFPISPLARALLQECRNAPTGVEVRRIRQAHWRARLSEGRFPSLVYVRTSCDDMVCIRAGAPTPWRRCQVTITLQTATSPQTSVRA